MKILLFLLLVVGTVSANDIKVIENPMVREFTPYGKITKIELTDDYTIVSVSYRKFDDAKVEISLNDETGNTAY